MAQPTTVSFTDFAAHYCERQVQTPEGLRDILKAQSRQYQPIGWMMLECEMLGGSRLGEYTILPFGPNNTYKEPPTHPISPRGLASDVAMVKYIMTADEFRKYLEDRPSVSYI